MDPIFETIPDLFPEPAKFAVTILLKEHGSVLEELRIRQGQPLSAIRNGKEIPIRYREEELTADQALMQQIVKRASGSAVYAVQEQLRYGYLSLPNGHRLGICGTAVCEEGRIRTIKEIQSLNLRIARQCLGAANAAINLLWSRPFSTLIAGCPGSGKTTVLRDLVRQLSDRFSLRVGLIDERGELAACVHGMPQFKIGRYTDILTGCPKEAGIEMLLRTMRPDWIALDEITTIDDTEAVIRASYCGAKILATAHVWQKEDLCRRPVYRAVMEAGIFENLILISPERGITCERIER